MNKEPMPDCASGLSAVDKLDTLSKLRFCNDRMTWKKYMENNMNKYGQFEYAYKWPDVIYLTSGELGSLDHCNPNDGEISWCQDKIEEHDLKYVRFDIYEKLKNELDILKKQA